MNVNVGMTEESQAEAEPTRLSDTVYGRLLDGILEGRYPPGSILSEVALAREMAVSRTPIHDALRQLAKDGLVQQQANRRAIVTQVSQEDVRDIFEMRKILETEATRRAASRIDRESIKRLHGIAQTLAATRERPDWLARWADFDDEFHETIASVCGSPRLYQDITRYRLLHRFFNRTATTVEVLQRALAEHVRILDALQSGDADAAAEAMHEHIAEWQKHFVNHFTER
jgi:DNA-binding GntR family transcriptional regulator